jgi:cytidylate kinase
VRGFAPVVAIDGPVGVGKSSVAKRVARELGFQYLDTGAMYRTVVWEGLKTSENPEEELLVHKALDLELEFTPEGHAVRRGESLEGEIRQERISREVYRAADLASVRGILVAKQQTMGTRKASVMEGRDITTVVFPNARWKFFLDASPEVRARRRFEQLVGRGQQADWDQVFEDLCDRDLRDRNRAVGALKIAPGSLFFDTTHLNEDSVVSAICERVRLDQAG